MKRISRRQSSFRHVERAARVAFEGLEDRRLMSVTASAPYALPSAAGVEIKPLLTVGDKADNGYEMMGIPDGMGAYDNGDGTFTLLMNHELRPTVGGVRAHGSTGAFVSKYVIRKSDFSVLSGEDLIKTTYLWENGAFVAKTTQLNRLCSADLPAVTAFFNPATGLGTTDRIFMNGEETNSGRSFAHVVTGPDAGTSWELPWTGKYAWENHVASPYAQDKTVVMGLDDSRREFSSEGATEPSEVYVWVGNKKESGSTIERAGLVEGILHGMRVGTAGSYDANESTVTSGERFELVEMSDQTNNSTFQPLQTESIAKSITQFRRVEDGHFDPHNPNVFYFVTTDIFAGQTRLWKLTFDDITNPEAGGVIEIAVDSPSSAPGEMFDNMTTNYNGDVLLQEDPGGQAYLAKIWQHDASTGDLIQVAEHNPFFFADSDRATPGNQFLGDLNPFVDGNQGTIDEESSGIIDLSAILGPGYYMINVQAHSALPDPYVEAGQLLIMNTNAAKATLGSDGVLSVTGTVNDDGLAITRSGQTLSVAFNGRTLGTFDNAFVNSIVVSGHAGSDTITVEENVVTPALLDGGLGDDVVRAGSADSVLVGGQGKDDLRGGAGEDVLIGDATSLDASALLDGLRTWTAGRNYQVQVSSLSIFSTSLVEDDDLDVLDGVGARDWMLDALLNDTIVSRQAGEAVN